MSTILFPVDFIENQIAPPDLKRICRICMGCSPVMSDIFMDLEGQPVNEFIMECFPVRIQHGEKLPELICGPCLEKLLVVRQFRVLCLHSDRCLRNELSTMIDSSANHISVLPMTSMAQHVGQGTNETFIDQSGNQVILVTNPPKMTQTDGGHEEDQPTYYILQSEDQAAYQQQRPPEITTNEDLILIDDDEDEGVASTGVMDNDVVTTKVQDKKKGKKQKRASVLKNNVTTKKSKTTDNAISSNNNSPEFQFVDIGAAATSDDNLIEILEDERATEKVCERCSNTYQSTLLEHYLLCSSNYRDCQFCGLGELNVLDFDKHIREMHIKDYRVCPHCRYVFLEEKHYQHHYCKHLIVVEFDVNNYTCAFCRLTFDSLKAFTHHYYKEHHKKTNCLCNTVP